jgi:hypothetical protein
VKTPGKPTVSPETLLARQGVVVSPSRCFPPLEGNPRRDRRPRRLRDEAISDAGSETGEARARSYRRVTEPKIGRHIPWLPKARAGPCRSVGVARKSLKSLSRAGCRSGWVPVRAVVCKPLKTLSVPVRAGARVSNPHTPIEPYRARSIGSGPRGSSRKRTPATRVERRDRGASAAEATSASTCAPWGLKSPGTSRGYPGNRPKGKSIRAWARPYGGFPFRRFPCVRAEQPSPLRPSWCVPPFVIRPTNGETPSSRLAFPRAYSTPRRSSLVHSRGRGRTWALVAKGSAITIAMTSEKRASGRVRNGVHRLIRNRDLPGQRRHPRDLERPCSVYRSAMQLNRGATPVASPQIERIWPVNRAGTVAAFRKPVRRRDRGPVFKALRALMGPPNDPSFQTALIEMSPIGVHI